MRYLLLIPATVAIVLSALLWAMGAMYRWDSRRVGATFLVAAVTFQVTAVWIASYLDSGASR